MYSPALGRFLQTDPIGYEDQMNLYAYVGNDPLSATDPSGLRGCGSKLKGVNKCSGVSYMNFERSRKETGSQNGGESPTISGVSRNDVVDVVTDLFTHRHTNDSETAELRGLVRVAIGKTSETVETNRFLDESRTFTQGKDVILPKWRHSSFGITIVGERKLQRTSNSIFLWKYQLVPENESPGVGESLQGWGSWGKYQKNTQIIVIAEPRYSYDAGRRKSNSYYFGLARQNGAVVVVRRNNKSFDIFDGREVL